MTTTAAAPATSPLPASSVQSDLNAGQTNLDTSYTTFLQLLTTQLKNQDPTSPLDPNQFTQQLVQMTGVQQQLLTNQLLQQLVSGSQSGGLAGAVGLIGKTVTADGAQTTLSQGQASWIYTLASPAKDATASITNAAGQVVWSGPVPDLTAGAHTFSWNGRDSSGRQLADGGAYSIQIAAQDAAGAEIKAATSIRGVAGSVRQSNGQTLVGIGATQVPLSSITGVGS